MIPTHIRKNISESEGKYMAKYTELVEEYSKSLPYSKFDLVKDIEPPKELFVEVRMLEDCGEIYLPETGLILTVGIVKLGKDTIHYLRKTEIEQFVKVGKALQL